MDMKECVRLDDSDQNWLSVVTVETRFNVASITTIGLQVFQNMFRPFAASWSMVHATTYFLAERTGLQLIVIAPTLTAAMSLMWYLRAGVGHLSYGQKLQCRLDRTRIRRPRMKTQSQLLAVIFLRRMCNAHAMERQAGQTGIQRNRFSKK